MNCQIHTTNSSRNSQLLWNKTAVGWSCILRVQHAHLRDLNALARRQTDPGPSIVRLGLYTTSNRARVPPKKAKAANPLSP